MKKFVLAILAILSLLSIVLPVDAQNPFYIYRNDGQFNAFFREEVDSITYSNYDLDSVYHDNAVVQAIYTQDSLYRIPLEAIDSVGFTQPKTEYSNDVIMMDNLIPYISDVNGMSLTLSPNAPRGIMPNVNEILLYEHFDNDMFPMGFAGRVARVSDKTIICDSVTLDDVYIRLIGIGNLIASNEQDASFTRGDIVGNKAGSVKISCQLVPDSLTRKFGLYGQIEGFLEYKLRIVYYHERGKKDYFNVTLSPGVGVGIEAGVNGKLEKDWITPKINLAYVPIPDTPFLLMLKGGPAIRTSLEASVSLRRELSWGCDLGFSYENGKWEKFFKGKPKFPSDLDVTGNMKGRFFAGYQTDFGIYSVGEIISVVEETEIGAEIVAEMGADLLDSDNYEDLSKAKVDVNLLADFGIKGELKFTELLKLTKKWELASISVNMDSWKFVPTFTAPNVDLCTVNKTTLSVIPSGKLLFPLSIGLGIWDNKQNLVDIKYCPEKYKNIDDWSYEKFQTTFTDLKPGQEYVVAPMVSIIGKDLPATPYTEFVIEDNIPVSISPFKTTDSFYSENSFVYKGKNYSFRYEAETTVTLDNAENVEDWGYVYEDLNEDTARISLRNFESPYTDTRYVYYRDQPISHVTLYGYIKYYGDKNIYYGNKHEFPLVYKKRPEVATLGTTFVDETSAKVKCAYKEIAPWGGTCGLEYWEDGKSDNPEVLLFETAQEEIEIALNNLKPATTYYYRAFVKTGNEYIRAEETMSFITEQEQPQVRLCPNDHHPHMIDLGLPSGTLWACCNVGADSPLDYGGLYCFGEPTGTMSTHNSWGQQSWPATISGTTYDIAKAKWGDDWVLPTESQAMELYYDVYNCEWTWTEYGNVCGYTITGPSGNSIFLPAAGNRWVDDDGQDVVLEKNEACSYWLGSCIIREENGELMHYGELMNKANPNINYNSWIEGVYGWAGIGIGLSVRPVFHKK